MSWNWKKFKEDMLPNKKNEIPPEKRIGAIILIPFVFVFCLIIQGIMKIIPTISFLETMTLLISLFFILNIIDHYRELLEGNEKYVYSLKYIKFVFISSFLPLIWYFMLYFIQDVEVISSIMEFLILTFSTLFLTGVLLFTTLYLRVLFGDKKTKNKMGVNF